MKKLIASILCACMISTLLVGCGDTGSTDTPAPVEEGGETEEPAEEPAETPADEENAGSGDASKTINVWAFTDEVPGMIEKYVEAHPDFGYEIKTTIIATTDGAYQPALDHIRRAMQASMRHLMKIWELMLTLPLMRQTLHSTQLISEQILMVN